MSARLRLMLATPSRYGLYRLLPNLVLLASLILLAMRAYLVGGGILIYQNWGWPLGTPDSFQVYGVYSPHFWTNFGYDPWGYTKSFATWPIALGYWFGLGSADVERVFVVFAWGVEYALAYGASRLLIRYLNWTRTFPRSELYSLLFVALTFVNPAAIQWEAGVEFPFLWGATLLEIAVLLTLLSFRDKRLSFGVLIGLDLGVCAALDPRLFIWGAGLLLLLALASIVTQGEVAAHKLKLICIAFAFSLPGVVLTAYAYSLANYAMIPLKASDFGVLQLYSSNSSPLNVLSLLGYWWSSITYGPPSILQANVGVLPTSGIPPYMIDTGGMSLGLWQLSLTLTPILAFGSLISRKYARQALPFAVIALIGATFSMGTQAPLGLAIPIDLTLGELPFVGSTWQTAIAVPIYFIVIVEACYVPLIVMSVARVSELLTSLSRSWSLRRVRVGPNLRVGLIIRYRPPNRAWVAKSAAVAAVAVLLSMLFLGSWQFANGSFYPAGQSPGTNQNLIPNAGALSPESVPVSDLQAFEFLKSIPSTLGIAWPSQGPFVYPWANRSSPGLALNPPGTYVEPQGLPYLLQHGLLADVAPLLAQYGAGYLVVDNMSSDSLLYDFGQSSVSVLIQELNSCPGLTLVRNFENSTWVFQDQDSPSILSVSSLAIGSVEGDTIEPTSAGAMFQLALKPIFIPPSLPISTLNLSFVPSNGTLDPGTIYVLTAQNISTSHFTNSVRGFFESPTKPAEYNLTSCGEYTIPPPFSAWTISVWSPCTNVSVGVTVRPSGAIALSAPSTKTLISLNYLSALTNGETRGIAVNQSNTIGVMASADLQGSAGSLGSEWLNIVASNSSYENVGQVGSSPTPLSSGMTQIQLRSLLPAGSALFTLRTFVQLQGVINISNVSLGWAETVATPAVFSGASFLAGNVSINFSLTRGGPPERFAINSRGPGRIEGCTATLCGLAAPNGSTFQWLNLESPSGATNFRITFSGNISVSGILVLPEITSVSDMTNLHVTNDHTYSARYSSSQPTALVLDEPFVPSWTLVLDGHQSIAAVPGERQTFFVVPAGNYTLTIEIRGLDSMPLWILGFSVFTYLSLAAFAVDTALRGGISRKLVRLLKRK